ncbi:MAG: RNA polymerase sigma factor [Actinomycetota bacterium]|nr:RNA polymerase sigma factor [Actinomycetota bacterium]
MVEDSELSAALAGAVCGDDRAFAALYRALQPGLLRYLRALVGQDAEDVAAEAWLQIARDIGAFAGDVEGFRGWATTIARRRAIDHYRRNGRRSPHSPGGLVPADLVGVTAPDDTEREAFDALDTARAIALIATLPRDQAEAVLLRVVVGLDANAAAAVLGKRPGAVRTAAHRGLRRLARQLEEGQQ